MALSIPRTKFSYGEHWVPHNFAVQVCPSQQHSTICQMPLPLATDPKISEKHLKMLQVSDIFIILSMHVDSMIQWWQMTSNDKPRSHALVMPQALNCWSCFTKLLQGLNLLTLVAWSERVWLKRNGQALGADIASKQESHIKRLRKRNKE